MTETPAELEAWAKTLAEALTLPSGFVADIPAVLDLARDAAHGVARPAAPLTTFLAGLAAGLEGGSPEAIERAFATARRLAAADPE